MSTIDWANLQQQAAAASMALPAGDYNLTVVQCTATQSKGGKPMFKTKFQVEDGPSQGRSVTNNFNLTTDNPVALRIFFRQMNALGLDSNFFAQNPTVEQIAAMMVGRRARVTLGVRKWQGEDQNEISAIAPALGAGPSGIAPMAAAAAPGVPQVPVAPVVAPVPQVQVPVPQAVAPVPQPVAPVVPTPEPVAPVVAAPVVVAPVAPVAAAPQTTLPMKWIIGEDGQPVQVPDMDAYAAQQAAAATQVAAAPVAAVPQPTAAAPAVPY